MPGCYRVLLGLLCGTLLAAGVHAQPLLSPDDEPIRVTHLTISDGLSQGTVLSILQDRHGFMWFGTQEGLNKYDGYRFTVYPNERSSLTGGDFGALLEDSDGMIWIGYPNFAGLDRFDPIHETVTHYRHDEDDPTSLSNDGVGVLYEDRQGTLWVGTRLGGLNRFEPATGTFTRFFPDPEGEGGAGGVGSEEVYRIGTVGRVGAGPDWLEVWSIQEDAAGTLWVGLGKGLYRYDSSAGETGAFTRFRLAPEDQTSRGGNWVSALYEDRQGALWVGGWGLHRFDQETGTFEQFLIDPDAAEARVFGVNRIVSILEDHAGMLWVGTAGGGLARFDRATGTFTRDLHDPDDPRSLNNNDVLSLYEDRQGILWVGTSLGLNRVDRTVQHFTKYRFEPSKPNSLQGNTAGDAAAGIFLDRDDVLWAGTLGGGVLNRFDRRSGTITHYRHDPADPFSAPPGHLMSIHRDRRGKLWVGSRGEVGGVSWLDEATGRFTHYMYDPEDSTGIGGNVVTVIYEDHAGVLWMGTFGGGLNRFNAEDETFTRYVHDLDDSTSISNNKVVALYEDRAGVLWVGTNGGGLNRFDRQTRTFTRPSDRPSLSRGGVTGVYERPQEPGVLWVVTTCCGLHRLDVPSGRVTHHYNRLNSDLPQNRIWSVLGDARGALWMSTDPALVRFDPERARFDVFRAEDGHEFNNNVYHKGYNGELFFGGTGGITTIRPEAVFNNPNPPEVALTGLRLFNEPVVPGPGAALKTSITETEAVVFSHAENDLTLEYVGLHFRHPERNEYAYMLEGYEEAWREVGTERRAVYPNLPPGAYVFRVKAANSDGVWSEDGRSLAITILPPWWRTTWAYLIYGLLFIGGAVAVNRVQRRRLIQRERERAMKRELEQARQIEAMNEQLEAQNRKLLELDELKSRFFANISHEFRTPLTLVLGPLRDALDGAFGDLDERLQSQHRLMHRNGRRLLRLINQLLDLSRLEAGHLTLRARRTNLVPLVRATAQAFSSLTQRNNVTLHVDVPQQEVFLYVEPDKIEKVLYNLLSNAFKFTPEHGKILVSVAEEAAGTVAEETAGQAAGYVEIVVRDTGQGIPSEELPYIFDRFYQVDASSTREQEGSGIGLALTKELVALHGGTVRVESKEDCGTAFFVRLPRGRTHLSDEDIVGIDVQDTGVDGVDTRQTLQTIDDVLASDRHLYEPPGTGHPAERPPENVPTILIVEDNPDVRAYLQSHLAADYHVAEAANGGEGLEQARALAPDLILADVMMPILDGYGLCRAVKADDSLNHIPVVLLTAKADETSKIEGLEAGADDYLYKPFNRDELLVRVENLIEIRRMLRARYSETVVVQPSNVEVTSTDAVFLEHVREIVERHLGDSMFSVEMLADAVGLSRRQLDRRLKVLTTLSASGFIRKLRLERAVQLLAQGYGNVKEVASAVGFESPRTFSKLFHQTLGIYPSDYPQREA